LHARFLSIYSYRVLTRLSIHWSQLVSDDNPRGYNEKQKQRIADADTLVKKRSVELRMMRQRLHSEMKMKEPIDDEYGTDRINAMIGDINAKYAAMGVNIGVTLNAGVVGTECDEDEEEDSDSDHEPHPTKRYVYFNVNSLETIASVPTYQTRYHSLTTSIHSMLDLHIGFYDLFHIVSFHIQTPSQHQHCFPATGQQQPLESPCHRRQPVRLRYQDPR
jgi:hypothetical protein